MTKEILEGRSPFTDEFRKQLTESLLFTVKCNKCDFETYLFDGFNNIKSVQKQVLEHFKDEHEKVIPVGRPK